MCMISIIFKLQTKHTEYIVSMRGRGRENNRKRRFDDVKHQEIDTSDILQSCKNGITS
jgi:hypothetical protein